MIMHDNPGVPDLAGCRIGVFLPRMSAYGGAERFAFRLSGALASSGAEVDYVCSRVETEPPAGVRVIDVKRLGLFPTLKICWYAFAADEIMKRENYDLTVGLGLTIRQDVLRVGGGPLDVFHRLSESSYPPGLSRNLKKLRRKLSPANILTRYLEKQQIKNSSYIVAVSDQVLSWLTESYPEAAGKKTRVIYNQADLKSFKPPTPEERINARRKYDLEPEDKVISCAGTNFFLKGVGSLVKALKLLPQQYKLMAAGGRNPAYFLKLAEKTGVGQRVVFPGKIDDVLTFYHASDLFVLPSFYDACSNAVLEALACGLKVVSSKDNGSSIFLPPAQVIADPGDIQTLAETIIKADRSPHIRELTMPPNIRFGVDEYLKFFAGILK